jgi:hypothetical protein
MLGWQRDIVPFAFELLQIKERSRASAQHLKSRLVFTLAQAGMPVLLKPMTGRRYYITTLAGWHRHAHRFANSHWLALGNDDSAASRELTDATRIIVLVDADEGVHLALDDDAAFEALPHPLAPKAISHAAHEALAAHGVAPGSTTFDAAEALARAHPLLRPRVF